MEVHSEGYFIFFVTGRTLLENILHLMGSQGGTTSPFLHFKDTFTLNFLHFDTVISRNFDQLIVPNFVNKNTK